MFPFYSLIQRSVRLRFSSHNNKKKLLLRRRCPRRGMPLGIHEARNDSCFATILERRKAECLELRVSGPAERNRKRGGQDRGRRDHGARVVARILTNRPRRHRLQHHFFHGYDHHRLHSPISDDLSTIPTILVTRNRSVTDSLSMRQNWLLFAIFYSSRLI